jgi:uncharacterized protein YxeA
MEKYSKRIMKNIMFCIIIVLIAGCGKQESANNAIKNTSISNKAKEESCIKEETSPEMQELIKNIHKDIMAIRKQYAWLKDYDDNSFNNEGKVSIYYFILDKSNKKI